MVIPRSFWVLSNQPKFRVVKVIRLTRKEFKAVLGPARPGNTHICVALFFLIFSINFSGLLPYVFPASRHLACSVSLGVPLWLGFMIWGAINSPKLILAHLVPNGTPKILIPFIVLIELVRNFIRPLTLSVRLAANIIAGHLLLTLLRSLGPSLPFRGLLGLRIALLALSILESAVGMIQAYVFRILSTLYLRELNTPQLI